MQADSGGAPEVPVDYALAKRWSELFKGVIQQFQRDGGEVAGNLEGDFTTREIKVRETSEGDNDSLWVSRTLSEAELRSADLAEIGRALYAKAKARARR